MNGLLVVVPCDRAKVWNNHPDYGPAPACSAYTGAPFKVNKEFAKYFAERWVVLSAKYGFIPPNFVIPSPYDVTFKDPKTNPISLAVLERQVAECELDRFQFVIGLGGDDYRSRVAAAFASCRAETVFPFAGLRIGNAMRATKLAIWRNQPM